MKKSYIALALAAVPAVAMAQSAVDAQQLSQPDFKGTARYMSMGGAFTALGGDLSAITQNPAGIAVYRKSEIGATLDINMQSTKTPVVGPDWSNTMSQTKAYCNNFGYVGSLVLGNTGLTTFNWGVSYNRAKSFDRVFQGYVPQTNTSLSNYIAAFSYGIPEQNLNFGSNYNPYTDSAYDWLSILAYNSYMINPDGENSYGGLFQNGTSGDALYGVREKGYVDQYDVTFGGNVENVVSWGIDFGITDMQYQRWAYYSESMANAAIPSKTMYGDVIYPVDGAAGFDLDNYKSMKGTGFNIKAGVIIRPTQEFRIGLAVHTPTWYNMSTSYDGGVQYAYTPTDKHGNAIEETLTNGSNWEETDNAYYQWKFNAPWRFMAGVAGVIGNRAIVSVDYQFDGYNSMNVKSPEYRDSYGYDWDYVPNYNVNNQIKSYYKNASTIRAGIEYRVTPQFSARAGYNVQLSNVKKETEQGQIEVLTAGTDPSYELDNTTKYITAGLGYKYKSWYIDAAYVYKDRKSTYHGFTDFDGGRAPQQEITDHNSSIVISTGFKF